MTTKKLTWPIIVMGAGIAYWMLTAIYSLKEEVHTITLLTSKDKEAIDMRFTSVETQSQRTENKANELEKTIIRMQAILPERTERKEK